MTAASSPGRKAAAALGRVGIWSSDLRYSPDAGGAIGELEAAGWPSIWVPGGIDDKVLADVGRLLSGSSKVTFATGILNIWKYEPKGIAAWWDGLAAEHRKRVVIGIGVSHGPFIGEAYKKPLETMRDYLVRLGDAGFPREHLCVAALGPKMLELSAELSAGAHPYLVPPEHTAAARKTLGPDALLAPEQGVVLETDPAKARDLARQAIGIYTKLPNYLNSWKRLGFSDEDISSLSDRFIDAIFAWGDPEAIKKRVQAHLDAGADHVCVQVITGPPGVNLPLAQAGWRALGPVLL